MRNYILLFLLVMGFFTVAQEKWSATFRPTLHIATRNVFHEPLRLGNGADITVSYALKTQFTFYAGITYNIFDTDDNYDEENIELKQYGATLGGLYFFNLSHDQRSEFYIRAGIMVTDIESRSVNDAFDINTDWAIGTQLGIGWKLEPSQNWFILPEMRYSNSSNAYSLGDEHGHIRLSYISITAGIMHSF